LTPTPTRYTDPRAHELRAEYVATFDVDEIPVAVESIAEDFLGLRIEQRDLGDCSGMLIPSERLIVVNAAEGMSGETPTRRHRFTIAHELGHWICHARPDPHVAAPSYCCRRLRCARRGRHCPTWQRWRRSSTCPRWRRTGGCTALG
jgi:hypothetical protein